MIVPGAGSGAARAAEGDESMAAKTRRDAREQARAVASSGARVRDRVRDLTVRALRGQVPGRGQISGLVHEVLEGASAGVAASIPSSRRSVLRQVYGGLSEAVGTLASAGSGAARGARRRGKAILKKDAPAAARRIKSANAEFLGAVRTFAGRMSGDVREELESLVRHTRRSAPTAVESVRKGWRAADGRLMELTGETARAGVAAARSVVGGIAMAAGGMLEGLAELAGPGAPAKRAPARAKKSRSKPAAKKRRARPRRPDALDR
jgi:Family of unknown function (DUF6781)